MSYFTQKTIISNKFVSKTRKQILPEYCKDKSVLHIGCMDWPITNYRHNLHIMIDQVCKNLVGIDVNNDKFSEMSSFLKNKELYTNVDSVMDRKFDVMLVPEVLEHVDDLGSFLKKLSSLKAERIIITVPDAYLCYHKHFQYSNNKEFTEIIHPDHNCWFSPYTLKNVVNKFTQWDLEKMYFIENMSVMGVFKNEKL
jgi:hypothetical protein